MDWASGCATAGACSRSMSTRSTSLSWRRGRSPWLRLSADHGVSPVAVRFLVVDPCCAGSCRFSGAAVEKTLALPQLQFNHRCSVLHKTAEIPQLQFIVGRRFSCPGTEADSHGLAVQQTMVIPRLQFLYEVIDVPVVLVVQVFIPVVALRFFLMVQTAVGP